MIKVEIHLFCSPYFPEDYWLQLVADGKVMKTLDNVSKDRIDGCVKWLEKYSTIHKELIKKIINSDLDWEEFSELYHIKVLKSKNWRA